MMISDKKNLCKRIPSPNGIAKQAGVLSSKSPRLKRLNLQVVGVSVVVIAQANAHHFPPPQKWAKLPSCFIKNVREFLNERFSAKFDLNFSTKSTIFFRKFVSENPMKCDFFPQPIRGLVL